MPYGGHVGSGNLSDNTVRHQSENGSAFSGSSGATNRKLTLDKPPISSSVVVWINGRILHVTSEYTVTGSELEILGMLENNENVDITYFTVG